MIYGAKKGSKGQQKPNIAKDTTASTNYLQGLYGLSEGEVFGLVDGGKSIKLDGTPLINDNGQPNFENVTWEFRSGTIDQEHIKGFSSVENEQSVGVELRHDRPFTRAISNTQLSAVVIRLNWGALREQKDNGDIVGYKIDYAIDVQTDGGAWTTVLNTTINDKASQGYQRSHRIDLPTARRGWTVRVRRITPNRDSDLIADTMSVQAITEVIDAKLRYPCTALLAIKYDAETFGNVAKVAVRMRGMIVQVPSNYNAQTRTYAGVWDGTFQPAYTNNPAWVFYDLCTAKRYGLGERLAGKVDKWSLYALGQYCDEMVDDGMGGKEPRFTVNVYIQKAQDAYQVLQSLASVFRAMSYWDGMQIIVDADTPKEPVYTFTNSNVVNGAFSYTGTRKRDRHSIAKVAYDDPDNEFKTDYVHVRDEFAIAKYGISIIDINAFGCTSRAQAYRAGAWALQSEQLETETVTFSAGLDGFIPKVGEVINVSDNARAGRANGGRVVSASGRTVTLDRKAGKVGDTFVINGTDGQAKTAKITAIRGVVITLDKVIGAVAGAVWAMTSSDLAPRQFRVMSIKQNDDNTFGITGLQYEPSKFSASDNGARTIARPVSVIKPQVLDTPSNIVITGHNRVVQGQNVTTLTINWAQVVGAVGYIVEWRKDDNAWQALPAIASQSIDIDGVYSGNYQARVRAVDAFDNQSLMGFSDITRIEGKQGKPTRLARLTATGKLFGMNLAWGFGAKSDDTNFTEIQVSPDGRSNITTLGTFAYPTNKHEITGLQGNLTQFYRGRIVDKLGNVSDWTAWVRGTTEARADKVLDILSGQISQSHLDQSLRTPIAKIGGIETDLNGVKTQIPSLQSTISTITGQLPTLNTEIANAKRELQTAQSTLNTAVANITTERNRINTAIRDITALQSANNAKTQELANLTQTVNGHTSQVRELAVTTGDLSQKYSQLKTATDTANSEIATIKQTQNGQATSIERLGAKFDSLAVGGRNYLLNSDFVITKHDGGNLRSQSLAMSNAIKTIATPCTLTVSAHFKLQNVSELANDVRMLFLVRFTHADGKVTAKILSYNAKTRTDIDKRLSARVEITKPITGFAHTYIDVYGISAEMASIARPKIELGTIATDWTPAPEDVDAQFVQTNANISTLQQAVANADSALSQRISALDASYKRADSTINASLTAEQKARADGDTALSQRITALDSAYQSADSALSARVATAEQSITTANQAIAQTQQTLTAKIDGLSVGGRNLITNSQVDNIVDGTRRYRLYRLTSDVNEPLVFTAKIKDIVGNNDNKLTVAITHNSNINGNLEQRQDVSIVNDMIVAKFNQPSKPINAVLVYANSGGYGGSATGSVTYYQVKAERGTIATDWTPAPEDVDAQFVQTNANISTLQQAVANADSALSQRISALDASYKRADSTINASLTAEQKARADGDTALSQRITALDSAYQSADSALSARVATAEQSITTANQAIAQTQQTLTAKIDGLSVGGRNLITNSQVDNIVDGTRRYRLYRLTSDVNEPLVFTAKIKDIVGNNDNKLTVAITHNSNINGNLEQRQDVSIVNDMIVAKFNQPSKPINAVLVYANSGGYGGSATGSVTYYQVKAERGTIATDWTPAPEDVDAQFVQTNANISTLQQAVANADSALSQRISALDASYKRADSTINASLTAEQKARADGDTALSQRITALDSAYQSADSALSARVATAEQSITTANQAIAQTQQTLTAKIDGLSVGGRNLITNSQVDNIVDGTRRYRLYRLTSDVNEPLVFTAKIKDIVGNNDNKLTVAITHNSNINGNLEQRQDVSIVNDMIVAKFNQPSKPINAVLVYANSGGYGGSATGSVTYYQVKAERGNIATDWTPAPEDVNVDLSPYATNANLDEFKQAQATKDTATASKLSQLESTLGTKASTNALDSLTTKVNQVDGKLTAEAQKISTLQTTVNGQSASIQQHAQTLNGLSAQWTLKVQSGNIVSGIGLASNNGVSDFAVRADKFYIASPTGQKGDTPFTVLTSPQVVNGVQVPAGTYIKDAYIANGSITMAKIADSIQSDNYVAGRQGWRLFKDGRFELNNTFGDGSSLELNSKGLIVWYNKAQNKKAVELGIFR
ncbi:TipJ family phage tail tip protein [Moraxella bovoculi]|uniref:TipJ family phage tail tip protein n=1 Tax=Moraxella bovoculi TaxID=386891 RepID=UPI0009BC2C02|nr:phage tail protein [Moraxella bovoculi]